MRARRSGPRSRTGGMFWVGLALAFIGMSQAGSAWCQVGGGLPSPGGAGGGIHRILSVDSPPGDIGGARLQRGGAVAGYFQPVSFRGPGETAFSLAVDGVFQPPNDSQQPLHAGLLIGAVYRFRVTSIPGFEGEELFPTLEVIDRTYPPHHLAVRYPIPIELDLDDLRDALSGLMVTRVIYLEDRAGALAFDAGPDSPITLDIPAYQDPLHTADTLGRPVAILRIGSVLPPSHESLLPQFFFGYPAWVSIQPEAVEPAPGAPLPAGLSADPAAP